MFLAGLVFYGVARNREHRETKRQRRKNKMFPPHNFFIVSTRGFLDELTREQQAMIYTLTTTHIKPECDFFVFDPCTQRSRPFSEDEGRTIHYPMPSLPKKVYAKLDDYGTKEALSGSVGHPVNTRYVLTFMLAEDY